MPEDTFANPVICPQGESKNNRYDKIIFTLDISVVIPAIVGTILALLVILVLVRTKTTFIVYNL